MFEQNYVGLIIISSFFSSFIASSLLIRMIIRIQKKYHQGQSINQYLDLNHQQKQLTPTLGGLAIIGGILISTLFYLDSYLDIKFIAALIILISFFIIGLSDDLIKVLKKNYHGLSSFFRFFLEFLIGIIIFYLLSNNKDLYYIDFFNSKFKLGALMVLIIPFIITGTANSVNLTDGLDGLSSSLYLIASIPFILISITSKNYYLTYLLISSFGATLGFIVFNLYPSKIFMGDSGSLSLGGLLGISAILLNKEFLLIICGGVFVFETLSVILQVLSFKLFKRRIFLMAPYHHDLEKRGKKEYQIVMYFFIVGLVLTLVTVIINYLFI